MVSKSSLFKCLSECLNMQCTICVGSGNSSSLHVLSLWMWFAIIIRSIISHVMYFQFRCLHSFCFSEGGGVGILSWLSFFMVHCYFVLLLLMQPIAWLCFSYPNAKFINFSNSRLSVNIFWHILVFCAVHYDYVIGMLQNPQYRQQLEEML